jgi:hypothetical protein
MSNESEVTLHLGTRAKFRHYDDDPFWVAESYDERITKAMIEARAERIPSRIDGHLFKVEDTKKVIEILAEISGIPVEFPTRKRRQDSEATKARLAARMQEVRQHQKA